MLTRACIRIDDSDALLTGSVLEEALLSAIVARACQSGEVYQDGNFVQRVRCCLRRKVQVECHLAICCQGIVRQCQQLAAKAGDGRVGSDRH